MLQLPASGRRLQGDGHYEISRELGGQRAGGRGVTGRGIGGQQQDGDVVDQRAAVVPYGPLDQPASAEDVREHLAEIDDRREYQIPTTVFDESGGIREWYPG